MAAFFLDLGFGRGFVGLPVFAGQILVGVDRAVGGGEQGVGLHGHVGGEFAGPLRLAFEADRGPVFGVAAVGGPGGRGAGLADLSGVETSRPDCGADEGPDDALEVHLVALSLREPSKASAIRLRALACSARIAS